MKRGNNGVSTKTIQNIQFGAGTIHKNLKCTENTWNFDESCVGATKGGSSLKITPTFYKIEPDGSTVAIKQFNKKIGEVATMDVNFLELTLDLIKSATVGQESVSEDSTYVKIESKADIAEGDYWDNIGFVGETADGEAIIAILDNVLCTSGLALDSQNNAESVGKYTFECHADAEQSLTTLPWHIYYPNRA